MLELSLLCEQIVLRRADEILARERVPGDADALRAALHRLAGRGASRLPVRVAASHSRMLLLPWLPQLTTPQRWRTLAMSRLEQGGESAGQWMVQVADELPPQPRLAVALPAWLVQSLRDVLKPRSIALRMLHALGGLLAREPSFDGCVAEIGARSARLLMVRDGQVQRVRTRGFETPDEIVIAARLEWAATRTAQPVSGGEEAVGSASQAPSVALLGGGASLGASLARALGGRRVLELS
jgi:hypothetical protein